MCGPTGIEPGTYRFMVRRANHYTTEAHVPLGSNDKVPVQQGDETGDGFMIIYHERRRAVLKRR